MAKSKQPKLLVIPVYPKLKVVTQEIEELLKQFNINEIVTNLSLSSFTFLSSPQQNLRLCFDHRNAKRKKREKKKKSFNAFKS